MSLGIRKLRKPVKREVVEYVIKTEQSKAESEVSSGDDESSNDNEPVIPKPTDDAFFPSLAEQHLDYNSLESSVEMIVGLWIPK